LPKFPSLPDWGELVRRGERLDGEDSVRLGDELPDWGELVRHGERLDGDDSVRLGDETS